MVNVVNSTPTPDWSASTTDKRNVQAQQNFFNAKMAGDDDFHNGGKINLSQAQIQGKNPKEIAAIATDKDKQYSAKTQRNAMIVLAREVAKNPGLLKEPAVQEAQERLLPKQEGGLGKIVNDGEAQGHLALSRNMSLNNWKFTDFDNQSLKSIATNKHGKFTPEQQVRAMQVLVDRSKGDSNAAGAGQKEAAGIVSSFENSNVKLGPGGMPSKSLVESAKQRDNEFVEFELMNEEDLFNAARFYATQKAPGRTYAYTNEDLKTIATNDGGKGGYTLNEQASAKKALDLRAYGKVVLHPDNTVGKNPNHSYDDKGALSIVYNSNFQTIDAAAAMKRIQEIEETT